MLIKANLGRIGIQEYNYYGRMVSVLRPESEVRESAGSYIGKPVSVGHYDDSSNAKIIGFVTEATYDEELGVVSGVLNITVDEKTLNIYAKKISGGYNCDLIEEDGVWVDTLGVHGFIDRKYVYEFKQVNINVEHVALVDKPRAGVITSVLKDDNNDEDITHNLIVRDTTTSMNVEYEGKKYKVDSQELVDLFDNLMGQIAALTSSKQDSVEPETEEVADSVESINIGECVEIWSYVLPLIRLKDEAYKPDYSLTPSQIKLEYLNLYKPGLVVKDSSDEYINGVWSVVKPNIEQSRSVEAVLDAASPTPNPTGTVKVNRGNRNASSNTK